jgi:hypothetical protein
MISSPIRNVTMDGALVSAHHSQLQCSGHLEAVRARASMAAAVLCVLSTSALDPEPSLLQALAALRGKAQADLAAFVNNTAALNVPLRPLPMVKGVFGWGYTLFNRFIQPPAYSTFEDTGIPPFFFANGVLDQIGNTTKGSYDRVLRPVKAAAVLVDLRHFSIADRAWLVRNETESSLPQGDQVARVIALASTWFAYIDAAVTGQVDGVSPRLQAAFRKAAAVLPLIQGYWASIPAIGGE